MALGYNHPNTAVLEKYLPSWGEGETMATQIATAVCKIVYKWYNDGDVYDNKNAKDWGFGNNISSYANWLYQNRKEFTILSAIRGIQNDYDDEDRDNAYSELLDSVMNVCTEEFMEKMNKVEMTGSVYNAKGKFVFQEAGWY